MQRFLEFPHRSNDYNDAYFLFSCSLPNFISILSPITIQFVVDVLYRMFFVFSTVLPIVLFGLTTTKLNKLNYYFVYSFDHFIRRWQLLYERQARWYTHLHGNWVVYETEICTQLTFPKLYWTLTCKKLDSMAVSSRKTVTKLFTSWQDVSVLF